jgi:hypothetical protein
MVEGRLVWSLIHHSAQWLSWDEKRETAFKIACRVTRFQWHFRSDATVMAKYDYYELFESPFEMANTVSEQQCTTHIQLPSVPYLILNTWKVIIGAYCFSASRLEPVIGENVDARRVGKMSQVPAKLNSFYTMVYYKQYYWVSGFCSS